ncbi:MAG: type III pantothenate kinase [Phycisphaerae bacterium]
MIYRVPAYDPKAPILIIEIGNTQTTLATWQDDQIKSPLSVPAADHAAFEEAYAAHIEATPGGAPAATVIGSVVPDVLTRVEAHVASHQEKNALVVGDHIPLPIDVGVDDAGAIGVDRVCAAATAFDQLKTGCTVVDFGTAVTVDLVDDSGTLCGGAILPGIVMQLRALHDFTAALPQVEPGLPEGPFGHNTAEAMQIGVIRGLTGAVRALVEGYAASLKRWPQVIATGGDLGLMAPHCDFLDTLVDHLALRGVALAYTKHMTAARP